MKFPRRRKRRSTFFDLTPLVDVVFLLLIFFMLSSTFIVHPGISVSLPHVKHSQVVAIEKVEITVDKYDAVVIGEVPVRIDELAPRLARVARGRLPVLIRADRDASLGRVVEVWDACKGAGITDIHIGTEMKNE